MIRRPPRSTPKPSSAASDVYKRQLLMCSRDCTTLVWTMNMIPPPRHLVGENLTCYVCTSRHFRAMHDDEYTPPRPPATRDSRAFSYRFRRRHYESPGQQPPEEPTCLRELGRRVFLVLLRAAGPEHTSLAVVRRKSRDCQKITDCQLRTINTLDVYVPGRLLAPRT